MIKNIKRMMLVMLAFIGFASAVNAQELPPVPVDSEVRIGQLPNGLTYYIRHNEYPKGQADFYIAQKVGSVLEEDNQRGLAHFLEHMCFNGTTHYPGSGLRDWLESVGVKWGYNLNAYTGVDETVYNISNVPVARQSVQDSCLLILHDWANDLTLDPEEIEKERGVIHEEWRRTMNGQMRILEKLLPVIYPNNRYGHRLPIGTMEVVDNFPPQAIRDYYETWYRPDQQGIVVVGDIDVDYIEGKIKEMFSDIEMPENAKERVYFPIEDTPGTIYAIGGDPEQKVGIAELMFKQEAIPNEMKGSMQYLLIKYINGMIGTMLDQRLTDIGKSPDAPFAQAGAEYGSFMLSKTKDAFTISAVAKNNDVLPGFEAAYRELLRAARGGFTVGEYERARAEYLSLLEKAYNGRDTRENETYVNEYVRHFIDNEPIPSLEDEYMILSQMIAPNIPVEVINTVLPEYITPDNRVLLAVYPENGTFRVPTQADFEAIIAKVDAEDIEPYKDETKSEPLIPELPAPGKVVSVTDVPLWDAKQLTLSNGVKVIVKTTNYKKDEILFNAMALGGTSTIGDDQAANLIYMPYAQKSEGLGTYNSIDIQRYLQGKQCGVDLSLSDYIRDLDGSSTVKDLPTLMELIYMTFTGYNFDPTEFEANQKRFASLFAAQEVDPQFVFSRDLYKTIYSSAAKQAIAPEIINAADREGILSIIKSMTSNAADYTFYFVGDVTVEQITPLLEQYIATLPADAKTVSNGYTVNLGREVAAGSETSTYTTKMENPQTWCAIIVGGKVKYTPTNKMLSSIVTQILTTRLNQSIREDMGATYSIGATGGMSRQGEYNANILIPFPMKPEMKAEVLASIDATLKDMAKNITPEELNPIKEFMAKSYTEGLERNSDWLAYMTAIDINGVDTFTDYLKTLDKITVKDVETYMKDLLDQNNYRIIILDPETVPAE